jgi:hypothetical protein
LGILQQGMQWRRFCSRWKPTTSPDLRLAKSS